jgi:hypothetical protein
MKAGAWAAASVAAAFATLLLVTEVRAYPAHRRMAKQVYAKPAPCEMCHGVGGTDRNLYGKAWESRGETLSSFAKLDPDDSDGDSYNNRDEILAGSNPGDPRSMPAAPGRYAQLSQRISIPTEQLTLVMNEVERIEAAEPDLTPAQRSKLTNALGGALGFKEEHPTIFFGVNGGRRVAAAMFVQFQTADGPFSVLVGVGGDGNVKKVALFRAGQSDGIEYHPYLACFSGLGRAQVPASGALPCAKASQLGSRTAALEGLTRAVRTVVWTLWGVYGGS